MLTKRRKHFRNARAFGGGRSATEGGDLSNGSGLFSDIINKVSSIASSSAAKQLGKSALEGATKGVKAGSEHAAKRGVEAIVDKVVKRGKSKAQPQTKSQVAPTPVINKKQTIDASTRSMLDKLKTGRGIKILN